MLLGCAVLNSVHPMIGSDIHNNLVPSPTGPLPLPSPLYPHISANILHGTIPPGMPFSTTKLAKKTFVCWGQFRVGQQGSDIGPFIPHIPYPPIPNILLAVIIPGSGSTSEFFSFSVTIEKKPVATAILGFGGLNVNCGNPKSLPTGVVIAPSTVCTGFRLGDFIASLLGMGADVALSWALSKIPNANKYVPWLNKRVSSRILRTIITRLPSGPVGQGVLDMLTGMFGVGSPIGYSSAKGSFIGLTYSNLKSPATQAVAGLFNPTPEGTFDNDSDSHAWNDNPNEGERGIFEY